MKVINTRELIDLFMVFDIHNVTFKIFSTGREFFAINVEQPRMCFSALNLDDLRKKCEQAVEFYNSNKSLHYYGA